MRVTISPGECQPCYGQLFLPGDTLFTTSVAPKLIYLLTWSVVIIVRDGAMSRAYCGPMGSFPGRDKEIAVKIGTSITTQGGDDFIARLDISPLGRPWSLTFRNYYTFVLFQDICSDGTSNRTDNRQRNASGTFDCLKITFDTIFVLIGKRNQDSCFDKRKQLQTL